MSKYVVVSRKALQTVLDYMWHDEERHYQETEAAGRKNHIFKSLKQLKKELRNGPGF